MIASIIRLFSYMIAELLPLGGEIHFRLFNYYFKYPLLSYESLVIVHVLLILGLGIYFLKDIGRMFGEFFKGLWIVASGRATIKRTCTDFKMLNMFLVSILITFVSSFLIFLKTDYEYSLYLVGALLILSAAILRIAEIFTLIKVDARIMSFKEALIFAALQALSMFPGVARPAIFMSIGKFLGIEKKHLAKMIFISFIPILIFELIFIIGFDPIQTINILYHSWLLCVILFALLIIALDVIFVITTSQSYYKFYYYLAGLGLWTILDLFFSKRGL
ncbi:MAG: undecaprenyl-diphosphate phosphatase [Proteobacteria bacterium]|nr:undecaprenyl-diphosphate phosphatase [Pseudomonadota bacterium]